MNNIIYMGYGFTLSDLDKSRLTDDEQNALDMLVENENLMDINATPLMQNSPIRAFQVEQCDSIFIYIPNISPVAAHAKLYTKDEANKLLVDYTRKMFSVAIDQSDLDDLNAYFDHDLTKDQIKEIVSSLIDKINIPKVAQEQDYVD